jgi:hypothetical protein
MAQNIGTLLGSAIRPADSLDAFPSFHANEGKGGFYSVATIAERDAITSLRREIGMRIRVISEKKDYELIGGITNVNWVEVIGGSDQDNKIKPIYAFMPEAIDISDSEATYINALANFEIKDFEIPLFVIVQDASVSGSTFFTAFPAIRKYFLKEKGKGFYGQGGVQLTMLDLELVYEKFASVEEVINLPTTQFINIGDIGVGEIQDVVNLDSGYLIQEQSVGYRIFTTIVNGTSVNYLFLAPGGSYGIDLLQTVAADFEAFGESNQNPNSFKQNKIYKTTLSSLGVDTFELLTPLIIKNWIASLNVADEDNLIYYYEVTDELPNFNITANWATGDATYPVTNQVSFELFLGNRSYGEENNMTNIVITDFSLVGNSLTCNLTADGSVLDISEMQVTEVLSCGNVEGLQILLLESNQIVTFNPTIALPVGLQYFSLGNNQIVTFNPTIALPVGLQYFSLDNNQIVSFNPTIALPVNLQTLSLDNNQIVNFNPTNALPASLQSLYLSGNQIVNFNPTNALPAVLVVLSLTSNQMTTAGYTASESWANAQPNFINLCAILIGDNTDSITGTNLEAILISKNCQINA